MAPKNIATSVPSVKEISLKPKDPTTENTYRTLWGTFQAPLIWVNIIGIFVIHAIVLRGLTILPYSEHKLTILWQFIVGQAAGFGIAGGAHRLWTHQSYKAKLPLRIILIIFFAMAGHNRLYAWVRDHRVHHKFSESDADPHNANRGFFFAHVGWLMMKKHPEVLDKGKQVDISDIFEDPVVVFFEKYFWSMKIFFSFIFPTMVPMVLWGETLYWSSLCSLGRYVFNLNCAWLVNSAAHMFGNKPYDKKIQPTENRLVSVLAMGEGWHNYHHTFPWDYKAAELGDRINTIAYLLDNFAKIGWAYDLKTAPKFLVEKTAENRGDGSRGQ